MKRSKRNTITLEVIKVNETSVLEQVLPNVDVIFGPIIVFLNK